MLTTFTQYRKKYQASFLAYFFAIAILFFTISILLVIGIAPLRILSQKNQLEKTSQEIIQHIENTTFVGSDKMLSTLVNTPKIRETLNKNSKNRETQIAIDVAKEFLNASLVYVMNLEGDVIASTNYIEDDGTLSNLEGNNYSFRPYFKDALKGQNVIYPAVGVTTGKRGIYCSKPIIESNKTIGVIVIKLAMENIDTSFNKMIDKALLFSPENIVFATNQNDWLYGVLGNEYESTLQNIKKTKQFNKNQIKPLPIKLEKREAYVANEVYLYEQDKVSESNWHLLILAKRDVGYPLNTHFTQTLLMIVGIILLLFIIIGSLLIIIARKKKVEQAILHHQENLRITLHSIGEGVIATNNDGIIQQINPAASSLTGVVAEQAAGEVLTNIFKLRTPKSKLTISNFSQLLKVLDTQIQSHIGWVLESKNGHHASISITLSPIKDNALETVGWVLVFKDNTLEEEIKNTMKQQFEQLKTALVKAEESDKLKTAFLQNISHEIRTPLNGIIGFSELLGTPGLKPKERAQYTHLIINNSQQLLEIIQDVIEVSKFEIKQVNANINEDDLLKTFDELYQYFKENDTDIAFELCIPENNASFLLNTDHQKLRKILYNLLVNAFKFTSNGTIKFGYVIKDTHVEFYVQDSGIGISKEQHDHIFKMFTQANNDPYVVTKGMGLGLTLAQKYVTLLNGSIWLESEVNKGSTFFFTIPYK